MVGAAVLACLGTGTANAAESHARHGEATQAYVLASVAGDSIQPPQVERVEGIADIIRGLAKGESAAVGTVDGETLVVGKDESGRLTVTVGSGGSGGVRALGACTWAVASAVYALGAAALGALAASGGAVVAGVFLSARVLGTLSGASGSFSAIYGIIAAHVC
ncbi:hypothetical protein GCM10012275_42510 [Longimycelium tulufanense]|uniref:Uncharacterized protein n=1 Tax=Longimycelium tulufanense TaxID=907463 RepID=A0A8J3CHI0_9PSEU|nr:hypothetical protein GCM10012275_42510 [Longimycelium tulufanense]